MKRFSIYLLFFITMIFLNTAHAGRNKTISHIGTKTTSTLFFEETDSAKYQSIVDYIYELTGTKETAGKQFFNYLSTILPSVFSKESVDGSGYDELTSWFDQAHRSGCKVIGQCGELSQQALIQLEYIKSALKNFFQYPQLYKIAYSFWGAAEEQTDGQSHDVAMSHLASIVPGGGFHHNLWDQAALQTKKRTTSHRRTQSIVGTMGLTKTRKEHFMTQMVNSMTPVQRQIIESNLAYLKETIEEAENNPEATDGGCCFAGCYGALFKSSKRLLTHAFSKRNNHSKKKSRKGPEREDTKKALIQELSNVISLIKDNDILALENGMKPSQMKVDVAIAKRLERWNQLKQTADEKLASSQLKLNERKHKEEAQLAIEPHRDTYEVLEQCYDEAFKDTANQPDSTNSIPPSIFSAALKVLVSMEFVCDQIDAKNELEAS